jgi:hypothetical protein
MVSTQEVYVGDSDLSSGDPTSCTPPSPPSQSEAGRVETLRAAHEEGSAWEKVAGVLVLVRVTDIIMMSCVDIRPQLPAIIQGLPPWNLRIARAHSPPFPSECSTFSYLPHLVTQTNISINI